MITIKEPSQSNSLSLYYIVLDFYQINEGGEIQTRDHLVTRI